MNEKLLKKTSIRITLMLIIIFAIIGVLTYKLYTDMNERKDRVVYTSDKEMQKDLCGIHRLIFLISGLSTLFQTNFFRLFFRYCTGV